MKRLILILAFLLGYLAAPARGQTPGWGYDATWTKYPITPAIAAVRDALDHGLCQGDAVTYITTHSQISAGLGGAGYWPPQNLIWYGKGEKPCDGKFQFVRVPDGPYMGGWEIRWASDSWVEGPAPDDWPIDPAGKHPTRWTITPNGPIDASVPVPPPTNPPPPSNPPPTPTACDLSGLQTRLDQCLAKIDGVQVSVDKHAEEFRNAKSMIEKIFTNPAVITALITAVSTWYLTQRATKDSTTPATVPGT
jgi:hypothetical protein